MKNINKSTLFQFSMTKSSSFYLKYFVLITYRDIYFNIFEGKN